MHQVTQPRLYLLLQSLGLFALLSAREDSVGQRPRCVMAKASGFFKWIQDDECEPSFLCYRDASNQCLIRPEKTEFSNGNDIPVEQPVLDPITWFLTEEQMSAARNGDPRTQLQLYSAGNTVTYYPSTSAYFSQLLQEFQSTDARGDRIYMTGWGFANIALNPAAASPNETRLLHVLEQCVRRGTDVRILSWANTLEKDFIKGFADVVNKDFIPPTCSQGSRFLFDDRLPSNSASHHQKTVIIRRGTGLAAFVGGIDATIERWDVPTHDVQTVRQKSGDSSAYNGWIDAAVRLSGPAAFDVANNFLARWNDKQPASGTKFHKMMDYENAAYSPLPSIDKSLCESTDIPLNIPRNGPHTVQVVRTYACDPSRGALNVAPRGEFSLYQARLKALGMAKNFIYIEDQYFAVERAIQDVILEVLPGLQRLIVITNKPQGNEKMVGYEKYVFKMVSKLQRAFPNKVQVYNIKPETKIYIHAKTLIIDDVFYSMGSGNWNRRSMSQDSEIAANIIDTEVVTTPDGISVTKLAREARLMRISELTKLPLESLRTMRFLQTADALEAATYNPKSLITPLLLDEKLAFNKFPESVRNQVDPENYCSKIKP
uniref:phospholipase D n=1 Tax=Albugo laibachii Nc14 TaxID=890382 RepID=F0WQH6_9STRA|nr:phospholipase D putative [Albugo laibachii Nc14]|eukprot:CCA23585.1 phospholipase D putative [Albugo laibachii Nc14]